jgi:hypothetical protein
MGTGARAVESPAAINSITRFLEPSATAFPFRSVWSLPIDWDVSKTWMQVVYLGISLKCSLSRFTPPNLIGYGGCSPAIGESTQHVLKNLCNLHFHAS